MQSMDQHGMDNESPPRAAPPGRWWREAEFWLAILLAIAIYGTRLTELTIRGEEPRWACVAQEMINSGDYVVPRLQGKPFPDRPPLNSWAMVAASTLSGELNLTAVRLPSVLATLLTVTLIYLYGRSYMSPGGALVAAAAYATLGQVLQLGRVAESDALLTLFLSGALLTWHYAYDRRRDARLAWLVGYSLAALAALCKGPQGPVYFVAITAAYLVVRQDWRFLFSRWHLAGVATFVAIVAVWQVPFAIALDPAAALRVWTEEGYLGSRFQVADWSQAFEHWAVFPLEVFGSLLPWSFLLPVLTTRWFWNCTGGARPMAVFAITALAVALPTCWLPVESRPRYLMSLYPCVALLVGLIVERSCAAEQVGWWRRSWDNYVVTGIFIVLAAPVALAAVVYFGRGRLQDVEHAVSGTLLVGIAIAALLAAALAHWSRSLTPRWRASMGMLSLAGFLGLSYITVVVNLQSHTSNDPSDAIASIRASLPAGQRLVSFGRVHHLFAHYYQEPIALVELSENTAPANCAATYFCVSVDPGFETPTIPFEWELLAEVSCERARSDNPRAKVLVGRRVSALARRPLRPAVIDAAVRPATLEAVVDQRD
jgi:4-amino-4-deoxy-L-arabinose transferase-like glycosyltransferase